MATFSKTGAEQEIQRRLIPENEPESGPGLPYGGKMHLAYKKKADPRRIRVVEAVMILSTLTIVIYTNCYFDPLRFHMAYGYPLAQHQVGQRYRHGKSIMVISNSYW
ncbi:uncharacterized protein LOC117317330 [Pecten maximus]|uniref:uncharacterized protein LOC117317330 n=1 Tax=Pecten maximus TaxID=6579 RepID=UPI001458330E|nr:uncharacterized protein LOC117317330 [Pecten maximus]